MKTALLLRGLNKNFQNTFENTLKSLNNPDVYIHTWDIDGNRLNPNDRFSYSQKLSNIDNLKNAYNPKSIIVESYENYKNQNLDVILKNTNRWGNVDMQSEEMLKHSIYSLHSQMYSFQKVVELFLNNSDLYDYENIVVCRFDYEIKSKIKLAKKGHVYSDSKFHNILKDLAHVINVNDIHSFDKIYDSLFLNTTTWAMVKNIGDKPTTCAENWYYHYITKYLGFEFTNGNINGSLIR